MSETASWGLWVEVSNKHFGRAMELWDDERQGEEPAFPGKLANKVHGYDCTLGLAGLVQLRDPQNIPSFTLPEDCVHPFAQEHQLGVSKATFLKWMMPLIHPEALVDEPFLKDHLRGSK